MTDKEKELIEMIRNSEVVEQIRNSDNPQMAMYKAMGITSEVTKTSDTAYLKG